MISEELTTIDNLTGLERAYIKSELREAFCSDRLVRTIEIDFLGRINIDTISWGEFWAEAPVENRKLNKLLDNLKLARKAYFDSHFDNAKIANYGYCYFILLSELISRLTLFPQDKCLHLQLLKLLSFENFALRWYGIEKTDIAAGTASHRNPAYLLAKLSNFQMQDDPKYLPIVILPEKDGTHLFYHYRQYKISDEPVFSLFLYPAISHEHRAASFGLIESFTKGFSNKSDPRSRQRAVRIADSILYPFLNNFYANDGPLHKLDINMADLGGGNGALVSNIWRHLQSKYSQVAKHWFLSCSFVGLRAQNPARHFTRGEVRNNMSYLDYCQIDYRSWLEKYNNRDKHQIDIVLMCRLLNNISDFEIKNTDDTYSIMEIAGRGVNPASIADERYHPTYFLNPENFDTNELILTNGKIQLRGDRIYRSLSLTDYYKGIHCSITKDCPLSDFVYYPTRKFNKDALELPDGTSLLSRLSQVAKLIAIEDADLNEQVLAEHFDCYKLDKCRALVINKNSRFASQIFAICDNKFESYLYESSL
ncbi:MAG: hypothetical protein ACYSSL_01420 [Planctomycetota bacterium]|jgi:hypothetical protein